MTKALLVGAVVLALGAGLSAEQAAPAPPADIRPEQARPMVPQEDPLKAAQARIAQLEQKLAPTPKERAKNTREALHKQCSDLGLDFAGVEIATATKAITLLCK